MPNSRRTDVSTTTKITTITSRMQPSRMRKRRRARHRIPRTARPQAAAVFGSPGNVARGFAKASGGVVRTRRMPPLARQRRAGGAGGKIPLVVSSTAAPRSRAMQAAVHDELQRGSAISATPKAKLNQHADAPTMRRSQSGKRWFVLAMPYGGQARSLAAPKDQSRESARRFTEMSGRLQRDAFRVRRVLACAAR